MAIHRAAWLLALTLVLLLPACAGENEGSSESSIAASANAPAASKGEGVRTLYLIRHGHYDYEDERDPDVGRWLTPLGVAQARMVASRLRTLGVDFDVMHASTMSRARQTAKVIHESFPELEPQLTRKIRECTPRTWREDVMEDTPEEEWRPCEEQLEDAFATYFTPSPDADRHEIMVCHGNVIRWFMTKALKVEEQSWLQMSLHHCSLTVIKVLPDGRYKILGFGDIGHIPTELQTGYNVERPLLPVE